MEIIKKYFGNRFTERQLRQFDALDALYHDWNSKINVISRKDIDMLYEHHVLHSLSIANVIDFRAGTKILDFGTGGGFPGIPLAIAFPDCHFTMIDGTGKKIYVAQEVANAIGLENVDIVQRRGEEEKGHYQFIVSRAVMPLSDLMKIVRRNIGGKQQNSLPNGVIVLKGGNIDNEIHQFKNIIETWEIRKFFEEEWFKEKYVIYLPA